MLLAWRVKPEVTRYMFSDVEDDLQKHRRWFASLPENQKRFYWIIHCKGKPIGLINLADFSAVHRRTGWGFYIGELEYWHVAGLVPPCLYNYIFGRADLNLEKVVGEVMAGNNGIMGLHDLHGYRRVGTYKRHVYKNGQFHDVHDFELLRSEWEACSNTFGRYQGVFEG